MNAPALTVAAPAVASPTPKATASVTSNVEPTSSAKSTQSVQGWAELVQTTRVCSVGSCANVLEPGWRWRRCAGCKAAGTRRSVTVPCSSCMSATTVSLAVSQSNKPSLCITCRQNTVATPSGIVLPKPPRISVMGPPEGRPSGQHKRRLALPLLNSEFPPKPKSIFESSAPFVHPDHLHVYAQSDSPAPELPAPRWKPSVFRPRVLPDPTAPHYGPRGEILAALPDTVLRRLVGGGQDCIAESPSVHSGHTPADRRVVSDSNMYAPDAQEPTGKPRKVSVTLSEGGAIKLKVPPKLSLSSTSAVSGDATSSTAATQSAAVPTPRKRKRMQPLAPGPVLNRVCFATGCGRPIPPHVEGDMCADCAFLRWRKQFRARVATLADDEDAKLDAKTTSRREPTSSDSEEESLAYALARKRAIRLLQQAFGPSLNPPVRPQHAAISQRVSTADVVPAQATPNSSSLPEMAPPARLTLTPGVAPPVTATSSPGAAPPMTVVSIPEVAPRATVVSSPSIAVASHEDRSEPARLVCPPTALITSTPSARSPSPTRSLPPQKFGSLQKLTLSDAQRQAFLVWDSDESELTPLEDSSDEGESETDPSESEDNVLETPTESTPLRPLAIQDLTQPPPPKHRGICEIVRCMNLLPQDSRLRACNVCRHRKRAHRRQLGVAVALDKADEVGMVLDMPADGDLTGYRKCGRASCKRLIPPEATYRWKSCPPCRVKSRNRQRVTRAVPLDLPDDDDDYLSFAHTPTVAQDPSHSVVAKTGSTVATTPWPPHTLTNDFRTTLPSVPAYQHFAGLMDAFSARFSEFTSAQKHYLRYKEDQQEGESPAKPRRDPIVFRFDGEYSIVADPLGGLVDALVQCVLRNVQAILGLTFTPVGVNAGPEESVIAVLRCMYTTQVSLQDSSTEEKVTPDAGDKPNGDASQTLTVRMVGELQIYVAWDRRHKFFPGQRILVRFRLVG